MKNLILLSLCSLITLVAQGRELYPEELVKLPSKSYTLILKKDIKVQDKRSAIIFYKGKIVKKLPIEDDLFYCELKNNRTDGTQISLEKDNLFRFSDDDGFYWEHFMTGRIWRKRYFMWDNDDVQSFSCNDTAAFHSKAPSKGVVYGNIKKAVGNYLKININ